MSYRFSKISLAFLFVLRKNMLKIIKESDIILT